MEIAIGAMGPVGVAAAAGAAAAGAARLKVRAELAVAVGGAGAGAGESATAESALVVFDVRRALTEFNLAVATRVFTDGFASAFVACADDAGPADAPESLSSA
jgi:hypothetical protein